MTRIRGFAIVSAIFILVVLAALGAFIVNISSSQQIGSALDVQGVRVYQAARAGIEWGVYQVQATPAYNFSYGAIPPLAVGNASPDLRACPASPASFSPAAPTLSNFTVTVTCTETAGTSGSPKIYTLQSTACSQPNVAEPKCPNITDPGPLYIERRIEVAF
ncbi:MAG: MSHA bioproteinis protein MshP [Rhodocyclaceae bacterium]|jgi:MSHA biogenesis protein MshP|nr:MAG: MSHA bioproteinis protein MshP [Rhodocyclaceae bacterium]TNC99248.1 MAG: MSHA bioproteinis protein MshP [Rhodocyclaceae bacterium]